MTNTPPLNYHCSLEQLISSGHLELPQMLRIFEETCEALAYLHIEKRIIHRYVHNYLPSVQWLNSKLLPPN